MKYFLKENGKEIKMGSKVRITTETKTPFGVGEVSVEVIVTPEILPKLISHGLVESKEDDLTMQDIVKKLAKRLHMDAEEMDYFLGDFIEVAPGSAMSLILKELAIMMNKNVKLKTLPKVWIISLVDGGVYSIDTDKVKNFKYIAPFTSKEQALQAKKILEPLFVEMYGE